MRKLRAVAGLAVVMALSCFWLAGCTTQEAQVAAQQAGMVSVITWISIDNPTDEQKVVAAEVVAVVKTGAVSVVQGESYFATLSPMVSKYVDQYVPVQSKAIAMMASGIVLSGIDAFFAMHPEHASSVDQALQVVNSFCDGAQAGLSMKKDSPVIRAATRGATERAVLRKSVL